MRLDRNWSFRDEGRCPDCAGYLHTRMEGPTDVVFCWRCKWEGNRFIEIPDDPPKPKKRRGGIRPRRKRLPRDFPRRRLNDEEY